MAGVRDAHPGPLRTCTRGCGQALDPKQNGGRISGKTAAVVRSGCGGVADLGGVDELFEADDESAADDEMMCDADGERVARRTVGGGVPSEDDDVLAVDDVGVVVGAGARGARRRRGSRRR